MIHLFISGLKKLSKFRSAKVIHVIVIVTLIILLPSYFICFANEEQTFNYESLTFTYIVSLISGDGAFCFGLLWAVLYTCFCSTFFCRLEPFHMCF